jgi:hypothetical protein
MAQFQDSRSVPEDGGLAERTTDLFAIPRQEFIERGSVNPLGMDG